MKRLVFFIIAAALAAVSLSVGASAQKRQRTTRPKAGRMAGVVAVTDDTLPSELVDSVMLAGYDKPLRSRRESLFVTNRTMWRLASLKLAITYFDTEGRELHGRVVDVGADVPPGATRQVTFPSWDRQLAFVYIHSEQPRRSRAIPYSVSVKVVGATIAAE